MGLLINAPKSSPSFKAPSAIMPEAITSSLLAAITSSKVKGVESCAITVNADAKTSDTVANVASITDINFTRFFLIITYLQNKDML